MAEQRSTSSVGATGSRGRITSSTLHTPNHTSDGKRYRPGESGFTNNQRLVLGYRPPLDLIDNPQYGIFKSGTWFITDAKSLCKSLYNEADGNIYNPMEKFKMDIDPVLTKWHYQPYVYNDGSGSKPSLFYKRESGFFQLNVPPKPLCQNEKSEYQSLYVTHPLVPTVSPEKIINIGLKGDSGFTKGEDLQINTFTNKTCTPFEARYTHNTVMKTDFQAPSHLQGSKVIPNLRSHACRETGYTRGTNAPLACPSSLLPSPWRTQAPSLLKTTGKKEPSGFLHNAPNHRTFPLTPQHSSHFLTHYDNVFGPVSGLRANVSSTGVILHNKLKTSYNQRDTDRLIFRDSTFI